MPTSDAFIVSEDWMSESYFTSDATKQSYLARVIERRKDWEARKAALGESPLTRFGAVRSELASLIVSATDELTDAAARADAALELTELLHRALGYCDRGRAQRRVGPITWVRSTDVNTDVVALVAAAPADSLEDLLSRETGRLTEPWLDEDGKEIASVVPRALSSIFAELDAPAFAVVFAARWVLIAERTRWAEGRYLAIDLQLVADRNETKRGGEIDSALAAAHADSFIPEADGSVWWSVTLEDSIKHTVGVSKDLREGIRLSIEDIANEVVRRRDRKGLEPLPDDQAQPLAIQSLRFLYRILFLLFAEASPELEVLPTNAADYDKGYSLDRLRELVQVKIETPKAKNGTHFYDSLAVLFRLVDNGHTPPRSEAEHDALTFNALRADLFSPKATAHIDEVALGNEALQGVLDRLLLSKKQNNRQRGFISYAELGINQLGAVYEGLMSYTGFFASEPLYEVAPNGDPSKGSWVVPVARVDADAENGDDWIEPHFVKRGDDITGAKTPVKHDRGEFVFRLAGRERQQSASYYTPEVLTRFTVSQALEELLDQNGRTSAEDVLSMTVCEPALGSGAFAIEAVRQLAEAYLARRQEELGLRVDPEEYTRELQRVKAYIALHQVYGVDLNGTAVELAEISLWLDTMAPGLDAPWFGLHLRRGNSLIGARRAVYSPKQVADKSWLRVVPINVALNDVDGIGVGIHHFLLPAEGWGATAEAKEGREFAPDAVAEIKLWRRSVTGKPTKKQVDELASLARRVEVLWDLARRRLEIANREIRRAVPIWGRDLEATGAVTREQIEASLADANGAYRRLRRIMDAWTALWFWPLNGAATGGVTPPTLEQWIQACRMVLGRTAEVKPASARHGQRSIRAGQSWTDLGTEEEIELGYAGAIPIAEVLTAHPWLGICERVAEQQGFFHWELDFSPVFEHGGFDLQVGNPPWVRPRIELRGLFAEYDPWWQLTTKASASETSSKRSSALGDSVTKRLVVASVGDISATAAFLRSSTNFPELGGLQPDLYRTFMSLVWRNGRPGGISALIHPETHFTDEEAGLLRASTYSRLRRHWQFVNALMLFEIKDNKRYGVHIYGNAQEVSFVSATNLLHPSTVIGSLAHDGSGPIPGVHTAEGVRDLSPHRSRILLIDYNALQRWSKVDDQASTPAVRTKMVFSSGVSAERVLAAASDLPRLSGLDIEYSSGWVEGVDDGVNGTIDVRWGRASTMESAIVQGPFIHVHRPFYKHPNASMRNNQDTSEYDLEWLQESEMPITTHKPAVSEAEYLSGVERDKSGRPAIDSYRIAWRRMVDNAGQRVLISAIVPPGLTHVDGLNALSLPLTDARLLLETAAMLGSLVGDFLVRASPKASLRRNVIERLPTLPISRLSPALHLRVARLNAVTAAYSDLWHASFAPAFLGDGWAGGIEYSGRPILNDVDPQWSMASPLRRDRDRTQAAIEIDVIVAIIMGISEDDLIGLYRSSFPALGNIDRKVLFDSVGRQVPTQVIGNFRRTGDRTSVEDRTMENRAGNSYTYELPFATFDREAEMRNAYDHFAQFLGERS